MSGKMSHLIELDGTHPFNKHRPTILLINFCVLCVSSNFAKSACLLVLVLIQVQYILRNIFKCSYSNLLKGLPINQKFNLVFLCGLPFARMFVKNCFRLDEPASFFNFPPPQFFLKLLFFLDHMSTVGSDLNARFPSSKK